MIAGNQYWFGLRKPPCQFLFSVFPCLQLFGNVSYNLYSDHADDGRGGNGDASNASSTDQTDSSSSSSSPSAAAAASPSSSVGVDMEAMTVLGGNKKGGKAVKKAGKGHMVVPAMALEMPD